MSALRILRAGPGLTIQDGGRMGYLRFGVTPAGPMDWIAARTANVALGNDPAAACLEVSAGGVELTAEDGPVRIACCGGDFQWSRDGAALPAAAQLTLQPGQKLSARAGSAAAWTYLAVSGGLDTPVTMGSRATHARSAIGGLDGGMLRDGALLGVAEPSPASDEAFAIEAPWLAQADGPIRLVLGPQDDYFSEAGLANLLGGAFRLTPAADRMAYRLEGPRIEHSKGFNIVSDGIAMGAIQVPGDGQPLILMADRQPTGGYPKVAHVIRADIGRLAQMRPGVEIRFASVDVDEARALLLAAEDAVLDAASWLVPLRRAVTTEALFAANLVSGVANAMADA